MKIWLIILCWWILIFTSGLVYATEGFTQEDRERLIRLETTLQVFIDQTNRRFEDLRGDMNKRFQELREDMNKRFQELREDMNKRFEQVDKRFEQIDKRFEQVDKRFEQVDKRFEQMMTFLWILTAIFTSLVAVVIGFAYWDRRTIIRKAREETLEYLEREGKLRQLIEALRELAKEDARLAEILRSYGLM